MTTLQCLRRAATPVVALAMTLTLGACAWEPVWNFYDDAVLAEYEYALGEQYIEINGNRVCYQDFGQGERTILILPGLVTSIDFWQLNIPAWAEAYRVVAVDYPGIGKSDKPDVDYELSWLVEQIVAFADAMGIDRATVVGGSLGGHLALMMARDYPDRVEQVLVMGSSGTWPLPREDVEGLLHAPWVELISVVGLQTLWVPVFDELFLYDTPMTDLIFRYQMAQRADVDAFYNEGVAAARAGRSIFYNSLLGQFDRISRPVLLVWGQYDTIHPLEQAQYFRDELPSAALVVIPDAAHEAMVDQPEAFNAIMMQYMAEGLAPFTSDNQ